jgi:hypothetical protein
MQDEWEKLVPFGGILPNELPVVEQANRFAEAMPRSSGTVGKENFKYANE